MSYIFGYKLKLIEDNIYVCAFPRSSLNKVMATLENKKINYIVLDRRNNYREDEKFNSGNLNKYDDYIKKAIKYVRRKNQIDGICEFLCYDKQFINQKRYLKFGEKIDDISKFTAGWIKSI